MNLSKGIKKQSNYFNTHNAQSDFQKLMDICNSYGLSQQETNQLIDQFKKGELFSPRASIDDSLNDSYGDLTFSQKQEEEYSFKNKQQQMHFKTFQKNRTKQSQIKISQQSQKQGSISVREQSPFLQSLEKLLNQKFMIQKNIVENLQQQNKDLKRSLYEKQQQISNFMAMKHQDTQIIKGLKDIITNLTASVMQKDLDLKDIQEKYTNLVENKLRQMTFKYNNAGNQPENILKQYTNNFSSSFSRANSTNKLKSTATLNEIKEHEGKISNRTLTESRQQQIIKNNKADQIYDQRMKNRTNNRVDVKKYKEMIENMRKNY